MEGQVSFRREHVAALYRSHGDKLRKIMQGRFGVPETETENLLHDIFATLLRTTTPIHDEEKWLVGATCNISRLYWRDTGSRETDAISDTVGSPSINEELVMLDQFLGQLSERARDVLKLRYLEGLSGQEIADRYGTSVGYTNVLIHRSLKQARELARSSEQ